MRVLHHQCYSSRNAVGAGMGGGSFVEDNVLFNFCRESSDHGPFNR